jgi:hypothetical protein
MMQTTCTYRASMMHAPHVDVQVVMFEQAWLMWNNDKFHVEFSSHIARVGETWALFDAMHIKYLLLPEFTAEMRRRRAAIVEQADVSK